MGVAIWTPIAESDLDDLLYYLAVVAGNPETAERIYFEIRGCVDRQANSSFEGHRHPAAPEGWRYVKHKRWLIFFMPHGQGIEVMRVIDAVRDLPKRLRDSL